MKGSMRAYIDDHRTASVHAQIENGFEVFHVVWDSSTKEVAFLSSCNDDRELLTILDHLVERVRSGEHARNTKEINLEKP